jgi:hypothetical protein
MVSTPASGFADQLNAGTGKVDITPPISYAIWGHSARHDSFSVGVLDPLNACALVFSTAGQSTPPLKPPPKMVRRGSAGIAGRGRGRRMRDEPGLDPLEQDARSASAAGHGKIAAMLEH